MSLRDLVQLARRPSTLAATAPPTEERGYSGGPAWGGQRFFADETDVNELWRPPARYATVRKMRAHPDTNAAIDAITLSLLSTDLEVVPGSDAPEDQDIADFVLEAEFIAHRLRLVPHVVRNDASNAIS